jgi:hypothetical protein
MTTHNRIDSLFAVDDEDILSGRVMPTSFNFRCENETRTLGEAYPVVKIADDNMRQFRKCLELMRKSDNKALAQCAENLDLAIADILHDESWAYWVDEAQEAHAEAMVRPVVRKPRT